MTRDYIDYTVIQKWMISDLGLSGNDLLMYSLIYRFAGQPNHYFYGSYEYMKSWLGVSTNECVKNTLQRLIDLNYIIKEEAHPTNHYYINFDIIDAKTNSCSNNEQGTGRQTNNDPSNSCSLNEHNNSNNSINNRNKNSNIATEVKQIVDYMNDTWNTKYKSNTNKTVTLIKGLLKNGYSIDEIKKVIDYKWKEWGIKPVRFSNGAMSDQYLRPSTVFGGKFEEYLNEAIKRSDSELCEIRSVAPLEERSDLVF